MMESDARETEIIASSPHIQHNLNSDWTEGLFANLILQESPVESSKSNISKKQEKSKNITAPSPTASSRATRSHTAPSQATPQTVTVQTSPLPSHTARSHTAPSHTAPSPQTVTVQTSPLPDMSTTKKRDNYISWPDYFMTLAFLSAQRSKDPRTQVGACITNSDNKILGIGYNGMPNGCHDDEMPWGNRTAPSDDQKYLFVCHAELNAVLNKNQADLKGSNMYVALFPCNECAKIIIQAGIVQVIYYSDKNADTESVKAAKFMFDKAGVKYSQHKPKEKKITINFADIDWTDHVAPQSDDIASYF